MKPINILIILVLVLNSCKKKNEEPQKSNEKIEEIVYLSFGKEINKEDALQSNSMVKHYKEMNVGDSINAKIIAKVSSVCQTKGCWMTLNLEDGNDVMVKFKDYSFFVPKDIAGKDVIVNGKAFVNVVSVDEQRHYAEDAGKTKEAIAQITEPQKTYSFEADGVLVKQ